MEGSLVDPVIKISMLFGLALLVQGHQQNMGFCFSQEYMPTLPIPRIELHAEQRRNFLAHQPLAHRHFQRIEHCPEAGEGAQLFL
ncbi:hypothetical protein D3C84_1087350 [compost metagenome]